MPWPRYATNKSNRAWLSENLPVHWRCRWRAWHFRARGFAFLTGAVLFAAAGWFRGVPSWWTTGGHLCAAGIATALLAAISGLIAGSLDSGGAVRADFDQLR
jgi:hypothetical protein